MLSCLRLYDMGCGLRGMHEVRMHPWFAGIDWAATLERRVAPPFVPHVDGLLDTGKGWVCG